MRSFSEGKEDAEVIVFVHGFPDDHTMWDYQVRHLKDRYRCVTVDLPAFGKTEEGEERRWGYGTDEITSMLADTIRKVGGGKPVILITHDWGCIYGLAVEKQCPQLVSKVVALDVGGQMKPTLLEAILIVAYQFWLALAFLLGRPIGDFMTRVLAPEGKASICYPYFRTWAEILRLKPPGPFLPKCPVLFAYGGKGFKKWIRFHSDKWLRDVRAKSGSGVVSFPTAGHWFMRELPEETNAAIDQFLAGNPPQYTD
ncbi:unnamed protein product [Discosporangium mesarthrocarpum]